MESNVNDPFPSIGIKSFRLLCLSLKISQEDARAIAASTEDHYRPYQQKKKSGGVREIANPLPKIKFIQKRIYTQFLKQHLSTELSFGAVPGRSHLDAAKLHGRPQFLRNVDVADCFPSVSHKLVYALFIKMGCSAAVARYLTKFTTFNGALPQGAPTSAALLNLILRDCDSSISELARRRAVVVTRHIDDISISGSCNEVAVVEAQLHRELNALSLRVNRKKLIGAFANKRQSVTGLNINSGVPSIPKAYRARLRDALRRVARFGATESEINSLKGRVAYVRKCHPKLAARFAAMLAKVKIPAQTVPREDECRIGEK